jgi:hypothetical protein
MNEHYDWQLLEARIRDRLVQHLQPEVSAMHLFTEVSNRTPGQQQQTATGSGMGYGLSSRKLPGHLSWHEWRDNHPACASSTDTMHVAVALSLDETVHIYTRQRTVLDQHRPTSISTDHHRTSRHHILDRNRSIPPSPIKKAPCRRKSNKT